MLALSRRPGESIMIGEDIEVTLLEIINGQYVKIGISAPRHIPVHRREIYLQIKEENKAAIEASDETTKKLQHLLKKTKKERGLDNK